MVKILEVPFVYDAQYRPKGAQKVREKRVLDVAPLRVRELAEKDFPVALRVQDWDIQRYDQVDDVRWDGLRLYRPFCYEPSGSRTHLPASVLDDLTDGRGPFKEAQGLDRWGEPPVALASLGNDVRETTRNKRLGELQRIANDLVICDGMLWDSCAEPCYEYSSGSWSVPPYFKVVFAYPERLEKPDGLVRADGMEQWLLDWEGTKAGAEPLEISGRIDVLMPQVLKLSVAGPTLVGRATRAVSSMEGHLKEYDVATFSSYAALRDALSASGGKATEDLVSAIDAVLETPAMAERVGHIRLAEARERFRREMSGAAAEAPATRRQGR